MTAEEAGLLDELRGLRVDRQLGREAPYQQVVLLWAISRTTEPDLPTVVDFAAIRGEVAQLLRPFAVGGTPPDPASPWFALGATRWWVLDPVREARPSDERIRRFVKRTNAAGGLAPRVVELLRDRPEFRRSAIRLLGAALSPQAAADGLMSSLALQTGERSVPASSSVLVRRLPFERFVTHEFEVAGQSEPVTAWRREAALLERYRDYLELQGHKLCRHSIAIPEEPSVLLTDLFDETTSELVESKSSSRRDSVRLALGQVLDYSRYVLHDRIAVLLPIQPSRDLVDLLRVNGVACIFEAGVGFERFEPEVPRCSRR